MGLVAGFNSYKWFFLSRLGYTPSKLCTNINVLNNYLSQRGKVNVVVSYAISEKQNTLLDCVLYFNFVKEKEIIIKKYEDEDLKAFYLRVFLDEIEHTGNFYIDEHFFKILRTFDKSLNKQDRVNLNTYLKNTENKTSTKIITFLIANENAINTQDDLGNTLLHYAIDFSDLASTIILTSNNIKINAKNNRGETPLSIARSKGHQDIVELLIQHGAK